MRNPALIRGIALACLAALASTACDREVETAEVTPPAATADPAAGTPAKTTPPPMPSPTDPAGAANDAGAGSFICENGHWVELVGDDTARVTLADGRVIDLPRKADGVAEYRGVALSFDLSDDGQGGVLGQDEVGGFDCEIVG